MPDPTERFYVSAKALAIPKARTLCPILMPPIRTAYPHPNALLITFPCIVTHDFAIKKSGSVVSCLDLPLAYLWRRVRTVTYVDKKYDYAGKY